MNIQMKQYISFLAAGLMAAALAGCADTDKPVFHPVDGRDVAFKINTPAMQDQYIETNSDMDNKSSFMLYCSQPDYGFATACSYNAQVSLDDTWIDAVTDENGEVVQRASYVSIANQDPTNAAMRFKCYDLAVAMCQLLGISVDPGDDPDWTPEQAWEDYVNGGGAMVMPLYFRATCEIPGVAGSFIASQNSTSYKQVSLSYAVPKPGYIYVVGDCTGWTVANDPTSEFDSGLAFNGPIAAAADFYENYKLLEPEIGCKVYAGTFWMPATDVCHAGASGNDYNTQWRYFTELVGWDQVDYEIASKLDNFWVEPITDKFSDGINNGSQATYNAVYGDGNFGVFFPAATAMTHVVSLEVKASPVCWFKIGEWDVTVAVGGAGLREPVFTEPTEE